MTKSNTERCDICNCYLFLEKRFDLYENIHIWSYCSVCGHGTFIPKTDRVLKELKGTKIGNTKRRKKYLSKKELKKTQLRINLI